VGNELAMSTIPGGFQPSDSARPPASFEIAFATEDVAAAFDRAVKAGAAATVPPKVKPWGQTVAYVRDMDGHLVELCTPMP
jgi:uncharacterized glyoxalase superfamily protein PhnB